MEEEAAVADSVTDGRAVDVAEGDGVPGNVTSGGCQFRGPRLQGLGVDVKAVLGQCLDDLLPDKHDLMAFMIRGTVRIV